MDPSTPFKKVEEQTRWADLANDSLEKFPIKKEEDFAIVREALLSIIDPSTEHKVAENLKGRIENLRELIDSADIYAPSSDPSKFRTAILLQIIRKVDRLETISPTEKKEFLSQEQILEEKSAKNKKTLQEAKAPSPVQQTTQRTEQGSVDDEQPIELRQNTLQALRDEQTTIIAESNENLSHDALSAIAERARIIDTRIRELEASINRTHPYETHESLNPLIFTINVDLYSESLRQLRDETHELLNPHAPFVSLPDTENVDLPTQALSRENMHEMLSYLNDISQMAFGPSSASGQLIQGATNQAMQMLQSLQLNADEMAGLRNQYPNIRFPS